MAIRVVPVDIRASLGSGLLVAGCVTAFLANQLLPFAVHGDYPLMLQFLGAEGNQSHYKFALTEQT